MWHVQANPETIAVAPDIAQRLVQLSDSGKLPPAYEGTHAAWFGETATGTYCGADYATIKQTPENGCTSTRVQSGTLTSPSFSLAGRTTASVSFHAWWEIEAVRPQITDLMRVEYSIDGGNTWNLAAFLNPDSAGGGRHASVTSGGWQSYSANLTAAAGQSDVRVRFVFDTVDRLRNGFRGLLVDDIGIVDALGTPVTEPDGGGGTFTDAAPTLSVTDVRFVQDADGNRFVEFTVVASHATGHPIDFDWTIFGNSGVPVVSGHGTLAPGQTEAHFVVPISGTDAPYRVTLENPSGASLAGPAASGTTGSSPTSGSSPSGSTPGVTPGLGPIGNPVFKKSFGMGVVSGTVRYHVPGGKYVTLGPGAVTLPLGSVVDATRGHALIEVKSDAQGTLQHVEIWQGKAGIFQVGTPAVTELRLAGGNYSRCATASRTRASQASTRSVRRLWGRAKGRFRTKGRYASATVRGTEWVTTDLCAGTRVTVVKGVVGVRDFRRHHTTVVRGGHSVLITALRTGRYRNRSLATPPKLSRVGG